MNKYGPKAAKKIEAVMHEYEEGGLKNAANGDKAANRKNAVPMGIQLPHKRGYKVPQQRDSD